MPRSVTIIFSPWPKVDISLQFKTRSRKIVLLKKEKVMFLPPWLKLCHTCQNKTRSKWNIEEKGYDNIPTLVRKWTFCVTTRPDREKTTVPIKENGYQNAQVPTLLPSRAGRAQPVPFANAAEEELGTNSPKNLKKGGSRDRPGGDFFLKNPKN